MDMVFHCCVVFIMDRINQFLLSYGKQRKENSPAEICGSFLPCRNGRIRLNR